MSKKQQGRNQIQCSPKKRQQEHYSTHCCSRTSRNSIDLLHLGGLVSSAIHLLKGWKVIVISEALIIVVDAESELDHSVNAASKLGRLIEIEARCQKRGVEEEPDQVLDGFAGLVRSSLLFQLCHDGVLRIYFHGLLGHHVGSHAAVTQGLCLHDTLHVGRPTILRGRQHTWGIRQTRANQDLLDFVAKYLLHQLGQRLELSL